MSAKPRRIGLTGPSGSGKSCVAEFLRQKGIPIVDCDALARKAVLPECAGLKAVLDGFGADFALPNGALDRKKLGAYVFADASRVEKLNALLLPHILHLVEKEIAALPAVPWVCLDAPTLFESGLNQTCAFTVGVIAPREICIARIIERDGVSEKNAAERLDTQASADFFRKACDLVIINDQTPAELNEKAEVILRVMQEKEKTLN